MNSRITLVVAFAALASMAPQAASAQSYPPSPYWSEGPPRPRYVRPFREEEWEPTPPAWREAPSPWYRGEPYPPRYPDRERTGRPQERAPVPATPLSPYERPRATGEPPSASLRDGGPRPDVQPVPPRAVPFSSGYAPGTIVIETQGRQLLLIVSRHSALRYPISVGRDGFQWTGTEKISRIAEWPDWHPPADMRRRDPSLPEKMTGGLRNPLGAKALYLGSSLYRIHGTNDARTIGYASSSGCFRMLNGHVVDLAERVKVGTPVVVIDRLPRRAFADGRDETRWR